MDGQERKSDSKAKPSLTLCTDAAALDTISINQKFARKYTENKQKQELRRLENRVGDFSSESSDSETEDEDAAELTKKVEQEIKNTIQLIRRRDPAIYDASHSFYHESDSPKSKVQKKVTRKSYKDLVREQILRGDIEDDNDDGHVTYQEKQAQLRDDFISLVQSESAEAEQESLEGGLFQLRTSSCNAIEEEDPEISETQDPDKFLDDYISHQRWKEKKVSLPEYNEIIKEDEDDAQELEKMEDFEHKYNFRFEEATGATIQTFPRKIDGLLRREEDTRKRKRQNRKEKKVLEKQKKEEELRRLKNLKQIEIEKKLDTVSKLIQHTTNDKCLTAEDLEKPFDPEEYDARMREIFNDEYYEENADLEKPDWEEVEVDEEDEKQTVVNLIPIQESIDTANSSISVEKMEQKKKEYLKQLWDVMYEPYIKEKSGRFNYRSVAENDYGLTADEILEADDAELRQFVSVKRLAPYSEREIDVNRQKVKNFKKQLRQRRKEFKKKEKSAALQNEENRSARQSTLDHKRDDSAKEETSKKVKKRTRRKQKKTTQNLVHSDLPTSRLESYKLRKN